MTEKKRTAGAPESDCDDFDVLDDLISRYYHAVLKEMEEKPKLGDLLKMIELRRKLTPQDGAQKELWRLLEKVRQDALTPSGESEKTKQPVRRRKQGKVNA